MDTETGELISDAQVAEVPYLAFTSRPKEQQVHGRLIVRRVKRLNPDAARAGQDELFTAWRHHAVFVTSKFEKLQAEGQHRDHGRLGNFRMPRSDKPSIHLIRAFLVLAIVALVASVASFAAGATPLGVILLVLFCALAGIYYGERHRAVR